MQNGTDIYPNFDVTPIWAIVAGLSVVLVLMIKFFGGRFLKHLALKKQAKQIKISKSDRISIINEAIVKLQTIKSAYQSGQKTKRDASFEASQITRETFDKIMNHSTRYQAKYETRLRNLESIAILLDNAYPPEFDSNKQTEPLDVSLFDKAIGVLESCR